jgi:transposase-like protein
MSYHPHEIRELIRAGHRDKARAKVVAAYRDAGAVGEYAARALDVNQATFWRWVKELDLTEKLALLEETAVRRGTKVERRGRPKGQKDSAPRKSRRVA